MIEYVLDNAPAPINFTISRGDTFSRAIEIEIEDSLITLTGDSFAMRISEPDGTAILNLVSPTGGIEVTGLGVVQWTASDSQTSTFPVNCNLPYDFQWARANGETVTLLKGYVIAQSDITP